MDQCTQGNFFIVGIGASAGGLEALVEFFKSMPADQGFAFIIVVHLDPTHVSLLPELLQKWTAMPVIQITDELLVEPNKVYVIPPNKRLSIVNRYLNLTGLELPRASHLPIDYFLYALAQDQGDKAICIILSGTGTDGSQGLREIKAETGLVIAQDEHTAKYSGMPKSAVDTGLVDFILPPGEIPAKLMQYAHYPDQAKATLSKLDPATDAVLPKILTLIRNQVGHDFSLYKKNTIYRRIERRMQLHQIEKIADYLVFLHKNHLEVATLAKELLIGVTNFFRDPEAFELLKNKVLRDLLTQKPNNYTLRVWVPGCSTGEEAYSIAIILQECLDGLNQHVNVQIFGTDIDETAIEKARRGIYPASISANVNDVRLKRFFIKEGEHFKIKKSMREMLVFATQNLTKDPPFTKLDLISCRNLLIYFSSELQLKILPLFHYGLNDAGILFLGSSETTGQSNEYFTILDRKWKIFIRSNLNNPLFKALPMQEALDYRNNEEPKLLAVTQNAEELSTIQLVEAILKRSSVPPCAVIDSNYNIIYIHGRLGKYLEPAEGKISVNIIEMIHPRLKTDLLAALNKAKLSKTSVQKKPVTLQFEQQKVSVVLSVSPILEYSTLPGIFIVVFEEIPSPILAEQNASKPLSIPAVAKSIEELQQELILTKENLQATIEELETANEELKSTNEELQSTNEELQSANEELETSKEELQSLNEETVTVNAELQTRIEDYKIVNDDLKNLFDSTQVATLFLDTKLVIRRFTPKIEQIINLVATDIGRPIAHFSCTLQNINLSDIAKQVLKTLHRSEAEIYDAQGRCFFMRVLPYRTTNNVIDGVILSFEDISARKQTELALISSEKRYKTLFDHSPTPTWIEDCSAIELSLLKIRARNISSLEEYLSSYPDEITKLLQTKRVLAINAAALSLFKVQNQEEALLKLPQLLIQQSVQPFIRQLQAIWTQQAKATLDCESFDFQGNVVPVSLTWTIPFEQGRLNYANIMTTALAKDARGECG